MENLMEVPGAAAEKAGSMAQIFMTPLQDLVGKIAAFVPNLVGAIIILIIGGIIAGIITRIIAKVFAKSGIDNVFAKVGLTEQLRAIGIEATFSDIVVGAIRIILKLVVWIAAIDALQIDQLSTFMNGLVNYAPNVVIAMIIVGVGMGAANFVSGLVSTAAQSFAKDHASMMASIVKAAIIVVTAFAALEQLGIATELVNTVTQGIIGALAIATGVAFGLGGQEKAKDLIGKVGK